MCTLLAAAIGCKSASEAPQPEPLQPGPHNLPAFHLILPLEGAFEYSHESAFNGSEWVDSPGSHFRPWRWYFGPQSRLTSSFRVMTSHGSSYESFEGEYAIDGSKFRFRFPGGAVPDWQEFAKYQFDGHLLILENDGFRQIWRHVP